MTKNDQHSSPLAAYLADIKINFGGLFAPERDIAVVQAPGVMNVLGGFAESSGSMMLKSSVEKVTIAGVQKRRDRRIVIKLLAPRTQVCPIIDLNLDDCFQSNKPITLNRLSRLFKNHPDKHWAVLPLGVLTVLLREKLAEFQYGVTMGIQHNIPTNAGLCAFQALLSASSVAFNKIYKLALDDYQLMRICHIVYEYWKQAPSSLMDIYTTLAAEENKLLLLRSQPHELLDVIGIPEKYSFFTVHLNTGIKSIDTQALDAHISAHIAQKIIFHTIPEKLPFGGFLCNIPVIKWRTQYQQLVPETIAGKDFLERYGAPKDKALIKSDRLYRPRLHAEQALLENERTENFTKLLSTYASSREFPVLQEAGRLLYESHDNLKFITPALEKVDYFMQLLKNSNFSHMIMGATAGFPLSPDTVVIFAHIKAKDIITNLMAQFRHEFGNDAQIFCGSSPGALKTAPQLTFFK
ncbi:hypothetical protein JW935_16090 [candidate division KSB1 bacterium]|nr:hypothetical protein [candidate division KSB1 bacterium]